MHVVHCKRERATHYIGRPGPLGNPHVIGRCPRCRVTHTRAEAIAAFEQDARSSFALLHTIAQLPESAVLGCWCKPDRCHGDVIVVLWYELHPPDERCGWCGQVHEGGPENCL